MPLLDEVNRALRQIPQAMAEPDDLARLKAFLDEAKKAGIALSRPYDLPLPDTIGRSVAEIERKSR